MEVREAQPELVVSDPVVVQALAPTTAAEATEKDSECPKVYSPKMLFDYLREVSKTSTTMVPICILLGLLIFHKLWLVWIAVVLIWSVAEFLYPRLPLAMRLRVQKTIPERWRTSRYTHEFIEGVGQVRPFVMFSLYMFCAPIAVLWIAGHWVSHWFGRNDEDAPAAPLATPEHITFLENNRRRKEEEESNFLHSPAFGVTAFALFACGLPAAVTYLLYQHLGMDPLFGFPSRDPQFEKVFMKIGLYIASVSWMMCAIFFRTWMTFPLNFTGDEAQIELTPQMVKRKSKNWFTIAATMNAPWAGRFSMPWDEMKYMGYDAPHMVKLAPLPTHLFAANTLVYKLANRVAMLYDGIVSRMSSTEYVFFSSGANSTEMGSQFKVCISDLSADQRAQLFYAVRKWAPHVVIDPRVQDVFLGTNVMQAPRYTQMWFELLTDNMPRRRQGALCVGDILQKDSAGGALEVVSRLHSGGQANVYIARRRFSCNCSAGACAGPAHGESEVVLKEFILSHADAVGALVESAGEFETESTLLSELQHDGIVKMLDFFAEDRRLYIVLEKLEGSSLRDHVRKHGPMAEEDVLRIGKSVAGILAYLHAQIPPVVHRDISPDNIILLPDGTVKVIDFSLAAAKKSRRTTSTMGKHSYAPPEQLREEPVPASDIYALGATLAYLLTGVDPRPITQSEVRSKRDDVSEELDNVIQQATALEVTERYSDVSWLMADLSRVKERQLQVQH